MDDIVPYEGNGDANNHSEMLNKTPILVRTHTPSPRTAHTKNRVHYSPQ